MVRGKRKIRNIFENVFKKKKKLELESVKLEYPLLELGPQTHPVPDLSDIKKEDENGYNKAVKYLRKE